MKNWLIEKGKRRKNVKGGKGISAIYPPKNALHTIQEKVQYMNVSDHKLSVIAKIKAFVC